MGFPGRNPMQRAAHWIIWERNSWDSQDTQPTLLTASMENPASDCPRTLPSPGAKDIAEANHSSSAQLQ